MFGFQMSGPIGVGFWWSRGVPLGVALSLNSFVMEREHWLSTWLPSGEFPFELSKGPLWPNSLWALGALRGRFCRESQE